MPDIRMAQRVTAPEPTLPAHLATKNYVDLKGLGGLKARDVGPVTNLSVESSGTATTIVMPPETAPHDGTVWTWLPSASHVWRSVPAAEGDLLSYQLRALLGNGAGAFDTAGGFDVVIMDSATGTPKRWMTANAGTPLVPSEWGAADMQYFAAQWNVNTMPIVSITVQAGDVSADGKVYLTIGYKPLDANGFRIEATAADPGQVALLNYGNGIFPNTPVPQHGALSGLDNDDHPQYLTSSRGDQRYPLSSTRGQANGIATLDGTTRVPIGQIPTGTTNTTVALGNHNHALASLTGTAISNPSTTQHLAHNGTNWVNVAGGLPIVPTLATVAAPVAGQLVLLTTDNMIYRYTGSAWLAIAHTTTRGGFGRYRRTTAQPIPNSENIKVELDVTESATADVTVTGSIDFTLNRAGTWDVQAAAMVHGTGHLYVFIANSDDVAERYCQQNISNRAGPDTLNPGTKRFFAAGSKLSLYVWQNSGAEWDLVADSFCSPFLSLRWTGP